MRTPSTQYSKVQSIVAYYQGLITDHRHHINDIITQSGVAQNPTLPSRPHVEPSGRYRYGYSLSMLLLLK